MPRKQSEATSNSRFPNCIPVRLHDGVVLKFSNYVSKAVQIKANAISWVKDITKKILLYLFKERMDTGLNVFVRFINASTKIHRILCAGFLFLQQFAEEEVDDFLSQRLVARSPGGHAGQVVPYVSEHRV